MIQSFQEFCTKHHLNNTKGFFVTATDTHVGKSYASALLVKTLNACYFKPIQAGDIQTGGDTALVKKLSGMSDAHFFNPIYNLEYPLSPHEASEKQGIEIDINLLNLPQCPVAQQRPIIIEGAGGVLVPINNRYFIIDIIEKFDLPVILVVRSSLGTLNHSLLTIQALRSKNIPIVAIIMSGKYMPNNVSSLQKFSGIDAIFCYEWT